MTAQALDEDRKESMDAGCDEHLSKPVSEQELIDVIRHFVEDSDVEIIDDDEHEVSDQDRDQHLVIDRRFEEFIPGLREDVREKMNRIKDLAEEIEEHAGNREPDEISSKADGVIEYFQQVTIKYT